MTTPTDSRPVSIELSRAEQWVVHHVLLDSVGLARTGAEDPPECVLDILEKLESGDHAFTPFELDHIRYACDVYIHAPATPERDRGIATAVVDRVDDALGEGDVPAPDPP